MASLIEMEAKFKKDIRLSKNGYAPIRVPQKKQAAYQVWKKLLKESIKRQQLIKTL
ncbi:hypothetical protein [Rahnella sp. AN3-3W3]|uniref:hypothetical protein n=1 Tax=Rahnella sp. AN3-3W3 TaxID=1610578 RepID=UPI001300A7ED|nr:hypothetical protein [Rahnella sp. AN3-3W3]